jgi:hypothetical protein
MKGPEPKPSRQAHEIVNFLVAEARRQELGQRNLSLRAGYCHANVYRWAAGECAPSIQALDDHLRVLGFRLAVTPI